MLRIARTLVIGAGTLGAVVATAAGLKIDLPRETVTYKPGPNLELVKARCRICHSADYVLTQPPNLPRAAWAAEVTKMKKVFGAPIADDEVDALADYLVKTYGNESSSPEAQKK
jgi:sulfite dehydrogenase (cytochrome) subunit B